MKRIIVILCVIGLIIVPSTMSLNISEKTKSSQNSEPKWTLLVTEFQKTNRTNITQYDWDGNILWRMGNLKGPTDAERLSNGNILITLHGDSRVIEVERGIGPSIIVWQNKSKGLPTDAERLPNGNTLISDFNSGVIEVDKNGDVVWEIKDLHKPMDIERLDNGNTLITEGEHWPDSRVFEVDIEGNEVWNISRLDGSIDAERLPNGNTLITTHIKTYGGNVTEYDENGAIVWQRTKLAHPQDAERLPNGNTLICETGKFGPNRVIEINPDGEIVWLIETTDYPVDVEILYNQPPDKPSLISPEDGSTVNSHGSATLEVKVTDPDYNSLDVHFYDASDDNLIGTVTGIACGSTASIKWTDLSPETTYQWYAVADDSEFETNSDTWSFTTNKLPPPSVKIEIIKPKEGNFYFRDKPLFTLNKRTIVYGPITIKANVESALASGVEKVEFYINDKLEKTFYGENDSYEYYWAPIRCGRYTIKTIAYDTIGLNDTDNIVLFKWRAHPILILTSFVLIFGILTQL